MVASLVLLMNHWTGARRHREEESSRAAVGEKKEKVNEVREVIAAGSDNDR